ncbi:SH3 domain-containing protein [uncultured Jannaschia sp.]|uniref:SH3 domain-containing protein n=1 Tax=uncultured Jannaschia sp. TaxID=293347 RepID=UPI002614E774|nr:SH3 domain-containing protein [uncultured Jannaschia sp.]
MRWIAAIWLLLAAGPAAATQDAWPALFDVAGVASDDVLNIRAAPRADAPILGTLAPDATGVEVVAPNGRETWGQVNVDEGTGWVSLRFLARQPGQWQGAFPPLASCFGTEPFWTVRVDGDTARWSTPEGEIEGLVTARAGSLSRRDRHGLRVVLADGSRIDGIISWRACNDGMSDRGYGLGFDALRGENVLSGCCALSK